MKIINVEIILKKADSSVSKESLISLVYHFLNSVTVRGNTVFNNFVTEQHPVLHSEVWAIIVEDVPESETVDFASPLIEIRWHVYSLDTRGPMSQTEEDDEGESNSVATHTMLPSAEFYNLWENLYYDDNIKQHLLQYAETMMQFSDRGIDTSVVSCNRVILLHGPPGTGKTSLCKSLAQKLSIRMRNRYSSAILIEINSHSLFSKWFSESGKLVSRLFAQIRDYLDNANLLVCVLIDEVESLVHARNQCLSGNEPSDSMRVVNSVLTQLDQIRRYSNVLILTTSNITESIDLAFIDRADIKQFLGLPTSGAIYRVYKSCIDELQRTGVITSGSYVENDVDRAKLCCHPVNECSDLLYKVCQKSVGLSGRSLRKIPFIAHALFLGSKSPSELVEFLRAMDVAVNFEIGQRKHFE